MVIALPAKARVRDVESVEVVVDSPPAVSRVQDSRCVDGNLCGMKTTPLTIGGHVCLNCHKKVHGCLCGNLWAERGDGCRVRLEDLSEQGRPTHKYSISWCIDLFWLHGNVVAFL